MTINCIAVDDEPLALEVIKTYCEKMPFIHLSATFTSAIEVPSYLRENLVDVILLDIQMEELSGIQLIQTLKTRPLIILTTAFHEYAVQGFELEVFDYMLKPISFERFMKGMNKAFDFLKSKNIETNFEKKEKATSKPPRESAFFFIKTETRIEKVEADEVLFVEGMGDYWRIVTQKRRIMTLMNAKGIEEIMHEPRFCRVHKSYFVSIDKIDFIERKQIKVGEVYIPISDTYQKHFFELIEGHKIL